MKIIIGNWKENPETLNIAKKLLSISKNFESTNFAIIHAVPSLYAGVLILENKEIVLQNISCFEGGSHTGEISATQAKNLGIGMSIVGHSETRLSPNNPHGDEDKQVNLKLQNLFKEDMWACLCIGEFVRDENYKEFIKKQITNCLENIDPKNLEKLIIAYEPVWAIGKDAKRVAAPEEIVETIKFIKEIIPAKVLYGGSVDENNAKEIVNLEGVDGLLIGRASSDPTKWEKLLSNLINHR